MEYQSLNKKQVGALLKVLSSDKTRPVLMELAICADSSDQTVLVATDGYVLAALPAADLKDLRGKSITRDSLTRWYKLASTRDALSAGELKDIAGEPSGMYPNWNALIDQQHPSEIASVIVNAEFMAIMQKLAGDEPLKYKFHGPHGALIADRDGARYVVMPLKAPH